MMWQIPAKTFALGEYVALNGGPAIILLTAPSFVMRLIDPHTPNRTPSRDREGAENLARAENFFLKGIHPNSPAGQFWRAQGLEHGLCFEDPYEGRGGFGASSAQFVGAYRAYCELRGLSFDRERLLSTYQQFAQVGSGYDVLAQTVNTTCVFIHRAANVFEPFEWPFKSLHFSVMHTGHKCQTHEHLAQLRRDSARDEQNLVALVLKAKQACDHQDEQQFADAINQYHAALLAQGLMSLHTDEKVRELRQQPNVLAAKGCGAMGSDVILLLTQ